MELARLNMIESQVRTSDVTDRRIIRAMGSLPRELFVPSSMRSLAYMDEAVKVEDELGDQPARYLMAAMPLAKMVQLAEINRTDLVLDIGCATGYSTALLASLADSVLGLEQSEALSDQATKTLTDLHVDNAVIVHAPLNLGYAKEGPYDVILINGAVEHIPQIIFEQLKEGGRLVGVVCEVGFGKASLYVKSKNSVSHRPTFDVSVPVLPGFETTKEFVF